jgi:hypothetical protein
MTPSIDKTYFIKFVPSEEDSKELSYTGSGVYRGTIFEEDGSTLFYMEDLDLEEGFTNGGWFSAQDIIGEVVHE